MTAVRHACRRAICAGVAVLLAAGAAPWRLPGAAAEVRADQREESATKIKAAFLYNFFLFVNWPTLPEREVGICILGTDPFGTSFAEVENQPVRGLNRRLTIRRLGPYADRMDFGACQILFVSSSERARWPQVIVQLSSRPVLTVSDEDGFLDAGGMVNFVLVKNKIRWEINRVPVNQSHLRIDAQLLESAVRVLPK